MGITGTSSRRKAADIVLTDDNSPPSPRRWRKAAAVYDNLIKSLASCCPTNLGLALILIYAVAFLPAWSTSFVDGQLVKDLLLPMLPDQISDQPSRRRGTRPAARFEGEGADVDEPPAARPKEPVLNKFVVFRTFLAATFMTPVPWASSSGGMNWRWRPARPPSYRARS